MLTLQKGLDAVVVIVNYSDDVEDDIRGIKTGSTSLRQLGLVFLWFRFLLELYRFIDYIVCCSFSSFP